MTNLDHFIYKCGSFSHPSFWLVGGSAAEPSRIHVFTHMVFGPNVFSLAARIQLLLRPKVFSLVGPFWSQNVIGPKQAISES